jgi:hypothetical protein
MTTTEWFMGLSRDERKAVLSRLHELRAEGALDTYGYGSATKGLMRPCCTPWKTTTRPPSVASHPR